MATSLSVHYCTFLVLISVASMVGCEQEPVSTEQPPQAPVEANVSIDKAVATTGDTLVYSIDVSHREEIEVQIPEIGSQIAGFRIIDFGTDKPSQAGNRIQRRAWYKLRGDLVGSYILPSLSLSYEYNGENKTLSTSELFVEIESVLPSDGSATDIRGLKPLKKVKLQPQWPLYVALACGLFFLFLTGLWLWRRYKRPKQAPPPPPPHEIAFAALAQLRETNFEDPKAVRHYFFSLSSVLRTYIEGRFALNATDLTTEELIPLLRKNPEIIKESQLALESFLNTTDNVKFADHKASLAEIETAYETTLSFVETTVPQLEEEPDSMESAA